MATQPTLADAGQIQGIIAWLEDQRKQDREEIARLSSEVERLNQAVRTQALQVAHWRSEIEQSQAALGRLPIVDEGLRDCRDQIADLVERLDQHAHQQSQALLLRASEADRDRRQVGDLDGVVRRVDDDLRVVAARLTAIQEEVRRDQGQVAGNAQALVALEQRAALQHHRQDQADERTRRVENQFNALSEAVDDLRAEVSKLTQWRQLADLRWSRQTAEWQQSVDAWREAAEEQSRPVQQLIVHVGQARDDVRAAQGMLDDHLRRIEDLAAVVARSDAVVAQQRETVARLEQAFDAQRRRFDEQASAQLRLDEALGRGGEGAAALRRTVDEQVRRSDELSAELRTGRDEIGKLRAEVADLRAAVTSSGDTLRVAIDEGLAGLEQRLRHHTGRMVELERVAQGHLQRLAEEMEQQAREIGEFLVRES